ncbi:MAG: ComEC/Rec2 family competence protein [Ilumatobacteraceae bacterium]
MVAAASTVAVAAATRTWWVAVIPAGAALVTGRAAIAAGFVVLALVASTRADGAWQALVPDRLGPVDGWAEVVGDAQRASAALRAVVEIDGERYELWVRGRAAQLRVAEWRSGDNVRINGRLVALDDDRARRVAWQHIVGELYADWLGDVRVGSPLAESSNRVRAVIERGAGVLPADRAALTRGLLIGDDRDQPPEMIERFRASGLSHLTAVSGQNVAFVLAAAGPLLRRARPVPRWLATLAIIGWFVVLTRAEPSVLRAATMAGLSATAFLLGRQRQPVRLLALAVAGLLLIDPLLAWSVGFWLSVGATAGVTGIGPWLARRLGRLGPLALPVAITIGAQVGVALPSLLVFGRLSVIGTVANLVAVPVAGLVMLYGLPASLLAGAVPAMAPVVMAPVGVGVQWIDAVATVGAAVEPGPPWSWLGWVLVVAVVGIVMIRSRSRAAVSR